MRVEVRVQVWVEVLLVVRVGAKVRVEAKVRLGVGSALARVECPSVPLQGRVERSEP